MNRFEMTFRSDVMTDGNLKKVWWVRAKYGHTIPVRLSTHPIYSFLSAYRQDRESTLPLDE